MRTRESDIVMVPGRGPLGPDHWLTRWEAKLSTARRVAPDEGAPDRDGWADRIRAAVSECRRPVLVVAHDLGVLALARAAPAFPPERVRGAFLVAMPDPERPEGPDALRAFSPIPRDPLPFPSLLVASRNDPEAGYGQAEDVAYAWGSALVDAGEAGHLDPASGFGPWPEGLLRLAAFLKRL